MFIDKFKKKLSQVKEQTHQFVESAHANQTIVTDRINTCNTCEYLFTPTRNCKKCGCFVDIKARFINSECPLGKW